LPVIFAARLYLDFEGLSRDEAKAKLLAGAVPPVIPNVEPPFDQTPTVTKVPSEEPYFAAPPLLIDTTALPDTSLVRLRGRETELAQLDAAWADPSIHVFSIIAWGGQGKTALVSHWVDQLKAEGGRGAEVILAWSFYSQGSKERATSADRFLDWALKKLDLKDPGPSATLKTDKIAEALKNRRVLLILDGVESLQYGPGPQGGRLKDPALRTLLRRAAEGVAGEGVAGLVLVTTRIVVEDLKRWERNVAPLLRLSKLSKQAGAQLIEDRLQRAVGRDRRPAPELHRDQGP